MISREVWSDYVWLPIRHFSHIFVLLEDQMSLEIEHRLICLLSLRHWWFGSKVTKSIPLPDLIREGLPMNRILTKHATIVTKFFFQSLILDGRNWLTRRKHCYQFIEWTNNVDLHSWLFVRTRTSYGRYYLFCLCFHYIIRWMNCASGAWYFWVIKYQVNQAAGYESTSRIMIDKKRTPWDWP